MNEPYYLTFIEEDLNEIFFEAGFKPGPTTKIVANSSKVLSWVKPEDGENMAEVKQLQDECKNFYAELKIKEQKILEENI